jgi:hypothetical protein
VLVDFTARDFLNLDEETWTVDKQAAGKQKDLKQHLQNYQNFPFRAQWTGNGITTKHIGAIPGTLEECLPLLEDNKLPQTLCEAVWQSLGRIIQQEIEHPHEALLTEEVRIHISPDVALDAEGLAHHRFAEERLRFFVGRTETLANIANYLRDNHHRSLAIIGGGGTGKSALMSKAIQQSREMYPSAEVVYRFIGVTPASSDGRNLLDSLCHELSISPPIIVIWFRTFENGSGWRARPGR